ncbi:BQ2448_1180 [Microbotryum intermedium]|uniref:BQ2448_1180 protein n=1 Tax=Microbotryum intermedium TaxID=269621 RepID=A0A238FFC0_9BASI|nr:BQ2448_1180 [Microbotryum intermedium]
MLYHISQQQRLALGRRQKRLAALNTEEGVGAAALNEPDPTDEGEDDPQLVQAKDRETVYKVLSLSDPTSSNPTPNPTPGPNCVPPPPIDRQGHAYDFVYHLAPNGSSDAYYHGPHPPPPSTIVNYIMKANKHPPFFDPQGLSSAQLLPRATELFQAPFNSAASTTMTTPPSSSTTTTSAPLVSTPSTEAIDALEAELIAGFSASCDERIGESLAKMEQLDREMALQRRDDERYAIGLANASQLQQQQQQQQGASQVQVGSTAMGGGAQHGPGPQGAGQYGGWR